MNTPIPLSQGRSFVLESKDDTANAFYIDNPEEMFKSTDKIIQSYNLTVYYPDGTTSDYELHKNAGGSWMPFQKVPDGNINTLNEVMAKIDEMGL